MKNEQNNKKNKFKQELKVGAVATAAVGVLAGAAFGEQVAENKATDLSRYNVDDTKCVDYIDEQDTDKIEWIEQLNEKVRIYKLLANSKQKLTESQKRDLEVLKNEIENELHSGKLGKFYLNDIFKQKMEIAYDVEQVIVNYTDRDAEEHISIALFNEYDVNHKHSRADQYISDEDKIAPIRSAVRDIVALGELSEKSEYTDKDIEKFVSAFDNMKGFSNLTFVKEGENQLYFEENMVVDLEDGEYTIYDMEVKDGEAKVISQKNIEVEDGKVTNQHEVEDEGR